LQKKIKSELEKSILNVGANAGIAVALNPKTGGVLSMVSLPDFNNNLFSQEISSEDWEEVSENSQRPLFNRVISGYGYPTGSVIKPLIGVAALEEDIINKNTTIYCPEEICVWNKYLKKDECFKDWTFHGSSDLKRAIAESVNTFFYIIGGGHEDFEGLGAEKIIKYLKLFNWGNKTGIDLPQEGKGILPEIDNSWRLGDTYHLSIGQGPFTATPIEVASAFGAIANGGKLISPRIVNKIIDSSNDKEVLETIGSELIRENFLEKENVDFIKEGMRQTVTNGSAVTLNNLPVTSAAKTGTAESSKENHYHHWVVVFAPYEDPEIVLVIMVEDIKGIKSATLPVAKEVLDWYFRP
jgi:penicillin-binding protein 2